jgi:hypothetical protein
MNNEDLAILDYVQENGGGEMSRKFRPRRYFFIEQDGLVVGTLAPLASMTEFCSSIEKRGGVREVTFHEWLPVAWRETDYVTEPPMELSEEQYWQREY